MTAQQVKERIVEGHYEVEEVPYGKVYKWVPGQDAFRGRMLLREDEAYRPERRAYEERLRGEEAHPYLRHYEWLELEDLLVR